MKVCFVGLGSIGKRHLFNFEKIALEKGIELEVHAYRATDNKLDPNIASKIHREIYKLDDLDIDYEIIFISNPTIEHFATIKLFSNRTKHMFIEKPLFHTTSINLDELDLKPNNVYYVAAPLRFSPAIEYVKDNINVNKIIAVRSICSSYLPDWRPGRDYRTIYSADKMKGGGVTLDLIHEWDYLTYIFGRPIKIRRISRKLSDLEIDCEDFTSYIAEYQRLVIELHLDYFGRRTERNFTIYTNDDTITVDILNNTISYFSDKGRIVKFQNEDIYHKEMEYFYDIISRGYPNKNSIENALNTLMVALQEED